MIQDSKQNKKTIFFLNADILVNSKIQKTRGELLIYSLINTHQRILALLVEFPQMT